MKNFLKKPGTWLITSFVFCIICVILGLLIAPYYLHNGNYELWKKLTSCQCASLFAQVLCLGVCAYLDVKKK